MKSVDKIDKYKLCAIRVYLVDNIFRNPDVMFSDDIINNDIAEIICDLYELVHLYVTGENYDYMFHWANKCGSWVENGYFIDKAQKYFEEVKTNEEKM